MATVCCCTVALVLLLIATVDAVMPAVIAVVDKPTAVSIAVVDAAMAPSIAAVEAVIAASMSNPSTPIAASKSNPRAIIDASTVPTAVVNTPKPSTNSTSNVVNLLLIDEILSTTRSVLSSPDLMIRSVEFRDISSRPSVVCLARLTDGSSKTPVYLRGR